MRTKRIDLVDGGEQRRRALADQRAFGHLLAPGAAVDRRAHGGVAEVDFGGVDRGASTAAPAAALRSAAMALS